MKGARPALVVVVVLALAAWSAWRLWPSDQRRIARALRALAADASVDGPESPVERLARAVRIGGAFTEDATIDAGGEAPALQGRDTIVALASRVRGVELTGRLRFEDVSVEIEPGGNSARTTMTATVTTLDRQSGDEVIDAREAEMQWRKQDGEWRIARVTFLRTLR